MSQKCYGLVGHVVDLLCKADSGPRLPHFEMSLEMTKCFPDEHTRSRESLLPNQEIFVNSVSIRNQ